mgnify:CR=1 FL=1
MYTTEHYVSLRNNLSNEKARLESACSQSEIELRSVWVQQLEKEIAAEEKFLASKGISVQAEATDQEMSDDFLLKELLS